MTSIRLLAPSLLAFAIVSCASQKADTYDTAPTVADAGAVNAPVNEPANPVYDTPAAYEDSGTASATPDVAPINPIAPEPDINAPAQPTAPVRPVAPSNGAAIIHTVVAGDTLSGLSSKYKVPVAAIKEANRMTKDTVVLGRKMVIPPVR
jgi:LysM repeat protein